MGKGKKRIFALCMIVLWCLGKPAAGEETWLPKELETIYARSAVVMDGSSGRVLFGKNTEEFLPMASTTKIMTCILALENCTGEETVEVSANAAAQPEVHLGAAEGERFTLGDLLYALMLESYNDAAVMIAEHVDGSVEAFAKRMNEKAMELGCKNTHFVTPNGLDAKDAGGEHGTTAEDLAQIMKYCTWDSPKSAEFQQITQTKEYTFSNLEKTRTYVCGNHNRFLEMYEGVLSGKTGFTSAAGYCYVTAVESEKRKFVGVVLACGWPYNRSYKWKDMTKLMDYARAHYKERILECPDRTYIVEVENGWVEGQNPWEKIRICAGTEQETKESVLIGEQDKLIRHIEYKENVEAPVSKNMVLGKVQFSLNGKILSECPILAQSAVERRKLPDWLVWTLQKFVL